ncbi:MAG: transposase [Actinomycetota bacterium]|nr:transposase [Actinomycetota bacterium]
MRLRFDRRLRLEFRGAKITTDAGLLAVRELRRDVGSHGDGWEQDSRSENRQEHPALDAGTHQAVGLCEAGGLRRYQRPRGLSRYPAMRAVIGKRTLDRTAASSGTVSRFETDILAQEQNIDALATLIAPGYPKAVSLSIAKKVILDIDSRVSRPRKSGGLSLQRAFFLDLLPSSVLLQQFRGL